ncbi:piggyBac transposable element-derived protein 4-like isoform X1 [Mya arenaria]|uniref:piggyBac transposable element-derived protein 4-like isoform X1 n=1 Tax=Mya arenaria TaxID=6604 RepID=UPI0022E905C6|nr:piggyBac transposable element-derived protein 4-like isoform X1 [Mya arenaria]
MTCNRFQKLDQYFHVSDRASEPRCGDPGYDRLFKVREVMTAVMDCFKRAYTLSKEVAVDEAMIKYSGRLSFRQYMPNKPIKHGVKVWMLCDSRSAYLWNFDVYLGRQDRTHHDLGHDVVMNLTQGVQNSKRHIYFDNFFTGLPLLESLLGNGLYGCGTVRENRIGFPKDLKKPRDVRQRGEFKVLQKDAVVATVWKDKRLVYHLSTLSQPADIRDARRRVLGNHLELQQPHTVYAYNKFMGGVDLHDQFRAKYNIGRCGKKWWRYIFWFILNCSIVNAGILYQQAATRRTKKRRFTNLNFREELLMDLIGGYSKKHCAVVEQLQPPRVADGNQGLHVNVRLSGGKTTCKYHSRFLKTTNIPRVVYGCAVCLVHLCKECHMPYHEAVRVQRAPARP